MIKNLSLLAVFILVIVTAHYYGVQRGAKAATDTLSLQLGMKSVDRMALNSALLITLKTKDLETALSITKQMVDHDVKHLAKIEKMLESLDIEEVDKNAFRHSILEAKNNHKVVNDL